MLSLSVKEEYLKHKSITKYLKNDFIVRGSFKPTDKILYLEFYKY